MVSTGTLVDAVAAGLSSGVSLPAGGTAGQALASTGSALTWSGSTANPAQVVQSGWWFDNRAWPTPTSGGTSFPVNTVSYLPFWLNQPITVNAISGSSAPSAGNSVNLGLMSASATTGLPETLLVSVAGVTTVSATIAATVLPAGWSYVAVGTVGSSWSINGVAASGIRSPLPTPPTGPASNMNLPLARTNASATLTSNPTINLWANPTTYPFVYLRAA